MIKNLQALRFIFSFTVMLAHFSYAGISAKSTGASVCFFAILSGFLLSKVYGLRLETRKLTKTKYLLRRLVKLYPLHLSCLLVYIVLYIRHLNGTGALALVPNALLLQSWFPDANIYFSGNSVSWYLSDVLFFLVVFPFLHQVVHRLNARQLMATAVTVLALYIAYMLMLSYDNLNYWLYIFPPVRLIDFTIGMLLWRAVELRPSFGKVGWQSPTEALLMAALVLSIVSFPIHEKWHTAFIHWLVVVPMMLVFFQNDNEGGIITRLLHTTPIQWLGTFTMEIFLLHKTVFNVIMLTAIHLDISLPYFLMMLLCFSAAIATAYCVHRWFVVPTTNWLSSYVEKIP